MHLMDKKILDVSIQNTIAFFNNRLASKFTKKNKAFGIGVAISLILIYSIYDRVFKPPKNIRHIPYFGYYNIIKSLVKGESLFDRAYKEVIPYVNSRKGSTVYMEPGRYGWEIHVSNPDDAKRILSKHEMFPKSKISLGKESTLLNKFVGGPNVLLLSGHEWKSQRKIANPAFHRSLPVKLFGEIAQEMFAAMDGMGDTVNFTDLSARFTLEAIGRAGFDFSFNSLTKFEDNEWLDIYHTLTKGLQDLKFNVFPVLDQDLLWLFPKRQILHKKLDLFLNMLDVIIQSKREQLREGNAQNSNLQENERDLLTLMIESEFRGEGAMTNKELKSNLCLFFFAGHDTTASALASSIYELGKKPELQQKAREEAISILGDEPEDTIPTVEDTKKMFYLEQVIKENLRLNSPSIRVIPRKVTEDTILSDGTFIPKGSLVNVNLFNVQHLETVWKNSNEFDPDRFSVTEKANRPANEGLTWLPFGSGARQCIGMNFSLNEQRVLLSMMLKKYTWTIPENSIHKDGLKTIGVPISGPRELDITFCKRY